MGDAEVVDSSLWGGTSNSRYLFQYAKAKEAHKDGLLATGWKQD